MTACAANGGQAPPELRRWLPWSMTEQELAALKLAGETKADRAEQKVSQEAETDRAEDSS